MYNETLIIIEYCYPPVYNETLIIIEYCYPPVYNETLIIIEYCYPPVYNETLITSEGSEFSGERLVLTCSATLHEKLKNLVQFVRIEWVGPSGLSMENMIEVGGVTYSECGVSRTLTFDPMKTTHSGLYRCILSITKEELAPFFQREIRHDLYVISE